MQPASVPVVHELWSLFEASLLAQGKQLVRDIAREQGVDPLPLWKLVSKEVRLQSIELPDSYEPSFCSYQYREGTIAKKCLRPVIVGHTQCPSHVPSQQYTIPLSTFLPIVQRYQSVADPNTLYFKKEASDILYTNEMKPVGLLHENTAFHFTYE